MNRINISSKHTLFQYSCMKSSFLIYNSCFIFLWTTWYECVLLCHVICHVCHAPSIYVDRDKCTWARVRVPEVLSSSLKLNDVASTSSEKITKKWRRLRNFNAATFFEDCTSTLEGKTEFLWSSEAWEDLRQAILFGGWTRSRKTSSSRGDQRRMDVDSCYSLFCCSKTAGKFIWYKLICDKVSIYIIYFTKW